MNFSFKKAISILLAVLIFASLVPTSVFAADACSFTLFVNPYGGAPEDIDTVEWYNKDGIYYIFLPADCDTSMLTVYFTSKNKITVNGTELISGQSTDVFASCGEYTLCCGADAYNVSVMKSENLPAIYIETESGSLDYIHENKNNKESGYIKIYKDGKLSLESQLKQIKGRGNASWFSEDKKPYNIKFDEKTKILGMDKAKKWTLLASASDSSVIRNPLAWYVANCLGIEFSSDYRIVDLYINGNYMGNYIICESVEIGKNRVNIYDLTSATEDVNEPGKELEEYSLGGTGTKGSVPTFGEYPSAKWVNIPTDPANITGGYLLECEIDDRYVTEVSGFVTSRNQCVVVKEPEYASCAQVKYISQYWQEAEDAIWSEDGCNSLGKHYSEYFDVPSLVNMYIMFEFSANHDGGKTSTFFYKDIDGKLVAAPVWDFDRAFYKDPSKWIANKQVFNTGSVNYLAGECSVLFNRLFRHEEFREAVNERWAEVRDQISGNEIISFINDLANEIEASVLMNAKVWDTFSTASDFRNSIATATNFISARRGWLDIGFSDNAAHIYYDLNGASGYCVDYTIYKTGDSAVIIDPSDFEASSIISPGDYNPIPRPIIAEFGLRFNGWNTEPDGSGTAYKAGDTIVLDGFVTLYAQWTDTLYINFLFGKTVNFVMKMILPLYNTAVDNTFRAYQKYTSIQNLVRKVTSLMG